MAAAISMRRPFRRPLLAGCAVLTALLAAVGVQAWNDRRPEEVRTLERVLRQLSEGDPAVAHTGHRMLLTNQELAQGLSQAIIVLSQQDAHRSV